MRQVLRGDCDEVARLMRAHMLTASATLADYLDETAQAGEPSARKRRLGKAGLSKMGAQHSRMPRSHQAGQAGSIVWCKIADDAAGLRLVASVMVLHSGSGQPIVTLPAAKALTF